MRTKGYYVTVSNLFFKILYVNFVIIAGFEKIPALRGLILEPADIPSFPKMFILLFHFLNRFYDTDIILGFSKWLNYDLYIIHSASDFQDLRSFIAQAQQCHLDRLDVLTPLDVMLQDRLLTQDPTSVISEAMSEKKHHEVGIMVDTVSALYKSTQSDLVRIIKR